MFDIDRDGFISDKDLVFLVKMMTGDSLTTEELTAIVVGTLRDFDLDRDGKLFCNKLGRRAYIQERMAYIEGLGLGGPGASTCAVRRAPRRPGWQRRPAPPPRRA